MAMDVLTANDVAGTYPASYYAATTKQLAPFPALKGDVSADVVVIGGGFTGLSTALHLAERGYDVVLLDAQRVGWGASGRNGGQLGSGQRVEQDELEKMVGRDNAHLLWKFAEQSKNLVKDLVKKHQIQCDLTPGIIHADHRKRYVPESRHYVEKLQKEYNYNQIRFVEQSELRELVDSPAYYGGSVDMGAAHLHPLALAIGMAEAAQKAGTRIFENSRVTKIDEAKNTVFTADGTVSAKHIVLGCNGYLGDLNGPTAKRVMPINNFIIATEPLGSVSAPEVFKEKLAVADSKFVVNYFRMSADNRLLFGGGESYGYKFPADIKGLVRKCMLEIFPQLDGAKIDYAWGGTLAITINRMPHFARLGKNIYSASGYSGHGVGMATLAGQIMADTIAGTAERFDVLANVPTHRFPGGASMRTPLLVLAMTYYALRDKL
ncbi:NAD(P)/FAD-dependent oxidoreductase [Maritalea porphyrae]|uniref:Gamma-glutamylputrescine oxidase n=1 Tax=Maritalea porphyrae TaxID=880732 RepID=A0ABQ5UVB4_9HYPH|nr:FAD-binding oxidoreductase [Maritalea porphyrae]GLQ18305.1 gamma-glutamylputrescine oxidase [Maritalea porphyrae]